MANVLSGGKQIAVISALAAGFMPGRTIRTIPQKHGGM